MIKGLEHFGVSVVDMDRSVEFYSRVLGLTLRHREWINAHVELAFLHHSEQPNVEVELVHVQGEEVHSAEQNHHLAFRVENIDTAMEHLKQQGITFREQDPMTVMGHVRVAFFNGPDGETLELVER